MQNIAYHIKWFYYYTFYVGIALRKRIRKKGADKQDVLEMNSRFWLTLLNGFLIATSISPIFTDGQELITASRERMHLDFTLPFIIKYGIDYYFFYWNKDWVRITHEFENNINQKTKNIYFVIFIAMLILSFCFMYIRCFL